MIELQSTQSMRVSLESIRNGIGGLDAHRASLLSRVPETGDWEKFHYSMHEPLEMKDLAYLTAKTGHEFAILRGKNMDILFHGSVSRCTFDDALAEMLFSKQLQIFGHSHPGEDTPVPSREDRNTLSKIGQSKSQLISGRTGQIITFTKDPFEF